jgi:hypothetical protein
MGHTDMGNMDMGNTASRGKSTKGDDGNIKKGEDNHVFSVLLTDKNKKASRLLTKRDSAGLAIVVSKEDEQNTPKALTRKVS